MIALKITTFFGSILVFESKLLLLIENFKKKKFYQNIELLNEFEKYRDYRKGFNLNF